MTLLMLASRLPSPFVCLRLRTFSAVPASGRRYTSEHEWVSINNGIGTVGITAYAAKALGDVVYVEIPEAYNAEYTDYKADPIGAVESVKAASDVYAPLSGEIVEANQLLQDQPSLINSSSLENGWLCKIKLSNGNAELSQLMDDNAYSKYVSASS